MYDIHKSHPSFKYIEFHGQSPWRNQSEAHRAKVETTLRRTQVGYDKFRPMGRHHVFSLCLIYIYIYSHINIHIYIYTHTHSMYTYRYTYIVCIYIYVLHYVTHTYIYNSIYICIYYHIHIYSTMQF